MVKLNRDFELKNSPVMVKLHSFGPIGAKETQMHRIVQVMRGGTPLPQYPGSLAACRRETDRGGGYVEYHCPVHGWVPGEKCIQCQRKNRG